MVKSQPDDKSTSQKSQTVRIYILEEQEIWKHIYKNTFSSDGVHVIDIASIVEDITQVYDVLFRTSPDVLLLGCKSLTRDYIETITQVWAKAPAMGIVLLFTNYNHEGIKLLRKMAVKGEAGMAVFLKQSIGRAEELVRISRSVTEGYFILDPALISPLFVEKHKNMSLKGLTSRELEVLSLLSRGFTNTAIAEMLYIDVKTVRHHLNSIYSKLRADKDFNEHHPRVHAAVVYLEIAGELLVEQQL
jgi:DNA-binding NarL/FixJ family response regulator